MLSRTRLSNTERMYLIGETPFLIAYFVMYITLKKLLNIPEYPIGKVSPLSTKLNNPVVEING
jgi:hypothetical protein